MCRICGGQFIFGGTLRVRPTTLVQIELNGGLTYGPLLTGKSQFGEGLLSEASTEDEDWTIKTDEYVGVDDLPDVKEPEDVPY